MIKESIRTVYRQLLQTTRRAPEAAVAPAPELPLDGWTPHPEPVPLLDSLSDEELRTLNRTLDFRCFTVDSKGRRFGNPAGAKKRSKPQELPDRRVLLLDQQVGLANKTVLEVGCFEGVHTTALCARARAVTALDSRVENVVKTIVRTSFYQQHPQVRVYDLERLTGTSLESRPEWMTVDVLFHVGVLYHLTDPVTHLKDILASVSDALLLDTHVATEEQLDSEYVADGRSWRYLKYGERSHYGAVFAGMRDHAKWLLESDLHEVLRRSGFSNIATLEVRNEKNGRRVCLLARKCVH